MAITPYRHYRTDDDLMVFHDCATSKRIPAANYYECFVFEKDDDQPQATQPKPKVAKKKARARAPIARRPSARRRRNAPTPIPNVNAPPIGRRAA